MATKNLPENLPNPSPNHIEVDSIKWIISILLVILLAVFGYIGFQLNKVDDLRQRTTVLETKSDLNNFDDLKQRVTVLETKFNSRQDTSKNSH